MFKNVLIIFACVLLIQLLLAAFSNKEATKAPEPSITVIDTRVGNAVGFDEMMDNITQYDLVAVGESHDNQLHHWIQLKVIEGLQQRKGNVGVTMEMFQHQFQDVVDDYLSGKITEAEFLQKTEYQKRWGYDWQLYRPIMEYARQNKLPVGALNASSELTAKIVKVGYDGLEQSEKEILGPVNFDSAVHRSYWLPRLSVMHGKRTATQEQAERSYQVMAVWDDYMARNAAEFHQSRGLSTTVILAGRGHIEGGFGIPDRANAYAGLKKADTTTATIGIVVADGTDPIPSLPVDYLIIVNPGN